MEITVIAVLFVTLLLSPGNSPPEKGWRGIVPLHSTRVDVEKLLGSPSNECRCAYYLEDVNLFATYATGDCKSGGTAGWNVKPDTIIRFHVVPKREKDLSAIGIDLNKYRMREDPEVKNILYYINDVEGVTVAVNKVTNEVDMIHYGPSAADERDERLRCPNPTKK